MNNKGEDWNGPDMEPNEDYKNAEEIKVKVRAVLALMREEWRWAAMDKSGDWYVFGKKPGCHPADTYWYNVEDCEEIEELSDTPYPGDWRESLVER